MNGGNFPLTVIDNINLNDSNIQSYVIENEIINESHDHFRFKFSQDNKEHKNLEEYKTLSNPPKYLGKGALTAVYKIVLDKQKSNYQIPEKYKEQLILRIFKNELYNNGDSLKNEYNVGEIDENNDDNTRFINMWMKHKKLFPENIIDFFMYGEILLNDNYLGFYTLTRTYLDNNLIDDLDLSYKIKYFKNMLLFLQTLNNNGYTYRDLKYHNIGTELIDGDYKFIVLDYDRFTILNAEDMQLFKSEFYIQTIVGTYAPFYIFDQLDKFSYDYLFVGGLLYTTLSLFHKDLEFNENYNILYGKTLDYIEPVLDNINNIVSFIDEFLSSQTRIEQQEAFSKINIEKDQIKSLQSSGRDLIKYIDGKKYRDLQIPTDKLIFIIGKIIKSCIPLNYDTVKKLCNLQQFIDGFTDIITDLDKQSIDNYYKKYMKYKMKYLQLLQQK